eukprot:1006140-Ditylum_brightwellii.AAC.1
MDGDGKTYPVPWGGQGIVELDMYVYLAIIGGKALLLLVQAALEYHGWAVMVDGLVKQSHDVLALVSSLGQLGVELID